MKKYSVRFAISIFCIFTIMILSFENSYANDELKSHKISSKIADRISDAKDYETVVVADFNDSKGSVTELGKYLSEQISSELSILSKKKIRVIDRSFINESVKQDSLIFNNVTVETLDKIDGIDILITGNVTRLDDEYNVNCKIIDVKSSELIGFERWSFDRSKSLDKMYRHIIRDKKVSFDSETSPTRNNQQMLRLVTKETERMNERKSEIHVRPLKVISSDKLENGDYSAMVKYHCIYSNPFERGVVEHVTKIEGEIYKSFLNRSYRLNGIEKLYKECENMSPSDKRS